MSIEENKAAEVQQQVKDTENSSKVNVEGQEESTEAAEKDRTRYNELLDKRGIGTATVEELEELSGLEEKSEK